MPETTRKLTEKFASVTGEFDGLIWAQFLSTMYSLAYFEDDIRVVLNKSAEVFPVNSRPHQIYLKCIELHKKYPANWHKALMEIVRMRRYIHQIDNIQASPDVNNGILILSILYGKNDYAETCKRASIAGWDGDCTSAAATGLMGIIKGMEGTPQIVKDMIYKNGAGVYVNDTDSGYPPYIKKNYPDKQKFTDIAKLYVKNAESNRTSIHLSHRIPQPMQDIPLCLPLRGTRLRLVCMFPAAVRK
jgi:hypothetical protein